MEKRIEMTEYVTLKFTKRQVETFLKYFGEFTKEWLEEEPKGQELQEAYILDRFFKKLKQGQRNNIRKHNVEEKEG